MFLACLLLVACGGTHLDRGVITAKTDTPAHDETVLVPQYMTTCTMVGKVEECLPHLTYFLPITEHHDEQWTVTVVGGQSEKDTDTWDVTEDWYDAHEVGDAADRPR